MKIPRNLHLFGAGSVVMVPRSGGGGAIHQGKITWLAADGRVIRTFEHPE